MKRLALRGLVRLTLASMLAAAACVTGEEFSAPPPEPDDVGSPCSFHPDCIYACMDGIASMGNYCTRACVDASGCPEGYVCASRSGIGRTCAIGPCGDGQPCPTGHHCITPDPNNAAYRVCRHDDIACTEDANCPGALACNQGACVTYCTSNADCKQGYVCHGDRGCVQCIHASDCANDVACVAGQCGTGCVDASDCRPGFTCVGAACQPIDGGGAGELGTACTTHTECADFCYNATRCSRTCSGEGDASCGEGFYCEPHHLICQPNG